MIHEMYMLHIEKVVCWVLLEMERQYMDFHNKLVIAAVEKIMP